MPLKKGSHRKTISSNIEEVVDSWKDTGKIGNSRPRSKKKAVKQAVAISLKMSGKSKDQNTRKGTARTRLKLVNTRKLP